MDKQPDVLLQLREVAQKQYLFLSHALRQMNRPERMISAGEIRQVIELGEIIEDYPEDARGHSCLILGRGDFNRPIHVVCSHKLDYLAIITAYLPSEMEWKDNFRIRRTR